MELEVGLFLLMLFELYLTMEKFMLTAQSQVQILGAEEQQEVQFLFKLQF